MFFLFLIIVYRDGIVNVFFTSFSSCGEEGFACIDKSASYGINIKIACRINDILPYFNKRPIQSNFLAHRNKVGAK